jgi:hypothetical protein
MAKYTLKLAFAVEFKKIFLIYPYETSLKTHFALAIFSIAICQLFR